MRDRPNGLELLQTAEAVVRESLLPALPKERRYEALMVLNALGIARRQALAGEAPVAAARARLAAIYGDEAAELATLERRLARDIRAGCYDPGAAGRAAVFDHLTLGARDKAAESSPKARGGGTTEKPLGSSS